MAVVIETTIGDFTVDLYTDERPQTCRNFLKLCKVKYYNWNLFHTVQRNFIAQTGDPTGTGKGGSSVYGIVLGEEARYYEAEQMPKIKHDKTGLLSMVNCGNNMLASQFFITLASDLQSLDGEHCVFGEIAEGLEIILKLNETICDGEHRPYQDIRISHTVILEDPFDDPQGLVIPDRSPKPTKEALMSDRIGADELIDDTAGMSVEEITEMQKEKEAKARATILEIVGDIPDADMAPPENVLFVCKLNPVTTDDDLEIIFSRFGQIVGCEVIRDRQTGDSLQYAFIEFGNRKSCEEAYFKMDNVLIDDRRIHVDFSQSVAKMRWRGKGKGIKYFDDAGNEEEKKKVQENTKSKSREESRNKKDYRSKNDYRGEDRNTYVSRKERIMRNDREYSRNGQKYRATERYQEYSRERYYADSRQERDYRRKPSEMFSNRRENKYRDRPSERSSDRSVDRRREESRSGNLEKHSKRKLSPSRETKKDKSQRRESKKHRKKEKRSKKESSSSSSSSDSDDESLSDSSDDSEDSDSSDSSSSSVSSESDNSRRKKKHAKHHRDHHQRKSTQRKHKGKKKRPR